MKRVSQKIYQLQLTGREAIALERFLHKHLNWSIAPTGPLRADRSVHRVYRRLERAMQLIGDADLPTASDVRGIMRKENP